MDVRLGTRGSALAQAQSRTLANALTRVARDRGLDLNIELHLVTTKGDTSTEPLVGLSQTGVFVAAVRQALLDGECDLVVHSLKDIPVAPHEGITLAALPSREDSRDALCSGGVALRRPARGRTRRHRFAATQRATAGAAPRPRGRAAARQRRHPARRRVGERYDAVVLAVAGLKRVGRADAISHIFPFADMLPAPGQGALAIETLDGLDPQLAEVIAALDNATTRAAVTAERAALGVLDAGCAAPVGAHASVEGDMLTLHVRAIDVSGTLQLNEKRAGSGRSCRRAGPFRRALAVGARGREARGGP